MADLDTSRLCEQIVSAHFGPIAAKVANALLTRGRLSLPQLIRFTSIRPQKVRASILVLIQHNIAWYAQSDDEGEMIEFNIDECLTRLRFGRYVWQAEQLFGDVGAAIVSTILDHGKLKPPDIISLCSATKLKEKSLYTETIHQLVSRFYLKPSTPLSHISPRDKLIQYEAEAKREIKNFPTAKELRYAREKAEARIKREEEEAEQIGLVKRKASDMNGGRHTKKRALDDDVVDDSVYFRVNAAKFNVHIRNQIIESAVRERYNDAAARVMRATLKATEGRQLLEDVRSEPISLATIASHISEEDDFTTGLIYPTKHKKSTMVMIKDYLGMLAEADNPTAAGRAAAFVSFFGSTAGKVQVEFETINKRLRRQMIESIAREQHGDNAVRVMRFLLDTGKMSADRVAKVTMTAEKDVRPLLTILCGDSFVSVQEVPKGADRLPQRTFYLWYVDLQKACSVQLDKLYKTLYNISCRRQAEEEEPLVKLVLEKMQRTDVIADPSLLSRNEREVLKEWTNKKEKLMILEMRVEEAVFILRDLAVVGKMDE